MQPNYLQYAQLVNQAGDRSGALSSLGQTIDQSREVDRQRKLDDLAQQREQRVSRLSDLQYDAGKLNLAQDNADSLALVDQYGTGDREGLTNQLAAAKSFQNQEAQMKAQQEKAAQKIQKHWAMLDHFEKSGASPEFMTEWTKLGMKNDPEMADLADKVSFVDKEKMIITKPFKDGELKDPLTGNPMPAGTYTVEAKRTGDPLNPYTPVKVEPAKPDAGELLDRRLEAQERNTTRQIEAADRRAARTGATFQGKPPIGYRFLSDGTLEAIPGGPADQKVTAAGKSQEGAIAAIDTAINSINDLINHPGRSSATGKSSITNRIAIPGGNASTFLTKLEAFKSQMFIPMVQQLKGMGQLSDAEGRKLTAAVGALEPNMSEKEFESSLKTILVELQATRDRSAKPLSRANYTKPVPSTPQNRPKGPAKKVDPLGIL